MKSRILLHRQPRGRPPVGVLRSVEKLDGPYNAGASAQELIINELIINCLGCQVPFFVIFFFKGIVHVMFQWCFIAKWLLWDISYFFYVFVQQKRKKFFAPPPPFIRTRRVLRLEILLFTKRKYTVRHKTNRCELQIIWIICI